MSVAPPQRTQSTIPVALPTPLATSTRQRIENRAELTKQLESNTDSSTTEDMEMHNKDDGKKVKSNGEEDSSNEDDDEEEEEEEESDWE